MKTLHHKNDSYSVEEKPNAFNDLAWFRQAAPYINLHRGNVFVIMFPGELVLHKNFTQFVHDISLLKVLGIKLVLVHGARPQIDSNLQERRIHTPIIDELRVTTRDSLPCILNAVGAARLQIEAQLTMGLCNSPMYGSRNDVVSGNYVLAKPYGVKNGIDFELTGNVRSIDTQAILRNLNNDQIVLLGSIGYSTTGEVFNLLAEQVAVKTAVALRADKLIFMGKQDTHATLFEQTDFIPSKVFDLLRHALDLPMELKMELLGSAKACQKGVARAHIVSYDNQDSLLTELFSRDGSGLMVSADPFEDIQQAESDDVGGLIALLTPLEEKGILVKRSREKLESEISHFVVSKRDNMIIACAALYPISNNNNDDTAEQIPVKFAEVACVAVHDKYRKENRGEKILNFLEKKAKKQGVTTLFVLTTQTAHWFLEQGFKKASSADLPEQKQALYNTQRNSHVYIKRLQ